MYIELFVYVIPFQLGRAGNKELWNRKSLCWTWSRTWKTQTGKLTTLGKNVSTRFFCYKLGNIQLLGRLDPTWERERAAEIEFSDKLMSVKICMQFSCCNAN